MPRSKPLLGIIIGAVVVTLLLALVSANLKLHIERTQSLWVERYQSAIEREHYLNQLQQSFGYGGFIHHFKNYLLRADAKYVPLIERSLQNAELAIKELENRLSSAKNQQALDDLSSVIGEYKSNYERLKQLVPQDAMSVREIDSLVKVDDTPAYQALAILSSTLGSELKQLKQQTDQQLGVVRNRLKLYQFLVMPLIYIGAFICILYLFRTDRAYTKLRAVFGSTPDALVVINEHGKIIEFNDNALELFSYSADRFRQLSIEDLVPDESAGHHRDLRTNYMKSTVYPGLKRGKFNDVMGLSRDKTEFQAKAGNGDLVPVQVELSGFYEGNKARVLAVVKDLTQHKKLEFEAKNDALTGLANRRSAEEMLQRELARAKRYKRDLGVIMLDLDHFKQINDRYGHQMGDEVLKAVGKVLSRHVRSSDLAARFGGEEFIMIYPETNLDSVFTIAEAIRFDVEAIKLPPVEKITASFGVSVYQGDYGVNTIDLLLQQADSALYKAKEKGRNIVCGERVD